MGCLYKPQKNVFHIFSDISRFRQRCRVRDRERYIQFSGECLRKKRFAGAGRPDHHDVALLQFHIISVFVGKKSFIMIVDRDGKHLFGVILSDHIFVEISLQFRRHRKILPVLPELFAVAEVFFMEHFLRKIQAPVADIDLVRPDHQAVALVFASAAESTVKLFTFRFSCHIELFLLKTGD